MTTRGKLEHDFTKEIIQFEKDYLGRGPVDARTFLVSDMVLIRLRGVLTLAEQKLAESREGQLLIKEARRQLFETSRPLLEKIVNDVLNANIISLHSDISVKTGERVIILTTDTDFDKKFGE